MIRDLISMFRRMRQFKEYEWRRVPPPNGRQSVAVSTTGRRHSNASTCSDITVNRH